MEFRSYHGYCLCSLGGKMPPDAVPAAAPFAPLVLLVERDPLHSRGCFAIKSIDEAFEPEGTAALLPVAHADAPPELRRFVAQNGATVLNTAFGRAFSYLTAPQKKTDLRAVLVGLGDVGGTLLTALKLLGGAFSEIAIFDPNEALCKRYEIELNQVLYRPNSRITICPRERLFDCDLFLFTASVGVPPLTAQVADVRMAQFAANRKMLSAYAKQAREAKFRGLFCQISDPVDPLARTVFLDSNRNENGDFDADGLLPEQICGFGLGVMAARAEYMAARAGVDFSQGRVYGPHGRGLVVADHPTEYHAEISERLTEETVAANLRVRELGFKPYIAPALSSAALSILRLISGEYHYGAVPLGGVWFGCRSRRTPQGIQIEREPLCPQLFDRIDCAYRQLEAFDYG